MGLCILCTADKNGTPVCADVIIIKPSQRVSSPQDKVCPPSQLTAAYNGYKRIQTSDSIRFLLCNPG